MIVFDFIYYYLERILNIFINIFLILYNGNVLYLSQLTSVSTHPVMDPLKFCAIRTKLMSHLRYFQTEDEGHTLFEKKSKNAKKFCFTRESFDVTIFHLGGLYFQVFGCRFCIKLNFLSRRKNNLILFYRIFMIPIFIFVIIFQQLSKIAHRAQCGA